ncbi:myc box-dependent-interacting protein 1 isoform X1 [Bemisia tabaci]
MNQFLCLGDPKMAESKGALIAKSVSKHAGRAKEKLLQNLGKVDRTADDIFDEHLQNFTRQQNAANKLQKEFNNYIRCIRAMQTASKTLMDSLNEIYESQWVGHDLLYVQTQNIEMLWNDFSHKLADQVLIPLNTYQSQFNETKKKIDKRGRKLVDYDKQRHNSQSLQGGNAKKNEVKMIKAREQLEEAKRTYDLLNSELHDELPALYDSRVLFLVTNLQTLFSTEQVFHMETAKVFAELEAIVDKLATESQRGSYTLKKMQSPNKIFNSNNATANSPHSPPSPTSILNEEDKPRLNSTPPSEVDDKQKNGETDPPPYNNDLSPPTSPVKPHLNGNASPPASEPVKTATLNTSNGVDSPKATSPPVVNNKSNEDNNNKQVEQIYDIPSGATTDNLPPGVLYRVKATYKYVREDVDELSFEVGEVIRVVEYEDPEEQEEGWLMGIKESSGEKGMFPANFTRPL